MEEKENGMQPIESATNFVQSIQDENVLPTSATACTNGHLSKVATVSDTECATLVGESNNDIIIRYYKEKYNIMLLSLKSIGVNINHS